MMSLMILAPSSSNNDEPMFMLFKTLRKVKAMPPPMINSLATSKILVINLILSLTLAPPKITTYKTIIKI